MDAMKNSNNLIVPSATCFQCKMLQPLWKIMWHFPKPSNIYIPYDWFLFRHGCTPKTSEGRYSYKGLRVNVCGRFICNRPNPQNILMLINCLMKKQNAVYSYDGIPFSSSHVCVFIYIYLKILLEHDSHTIKVTHWKM